MEDKQVVGATYREVQDIMYEYGAYNAANLDGGHIYHVL
jgi:exopolysaccharide biosynthesis protein